jgi:hypothetical protein
MLVLTGSRLCVDISSYPNPKGRTRLHEIDTSQTTRHHCKTDAPNRPIRRNAPLNGPHAVGNDIEGRNNSRHKKSPVKTGLSYCFGETHISPSRAKQLQGGFRREGVSVPLVRDRLESKPKAADASAAGEITSCRPFRPYRRPYHPYQA